MGASGMIYKVGPNYNPSFRLIRENDKWGFLTTNKFDKLAEKRIISLCGSSCEFAMIVNGKELNDMFEECGDEQRVKEDYDFYLILWDV